MVVGITAPEDNLAAAQLPETQITFAELNLRTQTDYRSSFSANSGSTSFGLDCAFLVSASRAGKMLLYHNGYPSTDRSATAGFRIDGKLAVHQFQPLPHADKPYTVMVGSGLLVKADSKVTHGQL